jgi:Glycosyl hydrolase catalytic core
MARLYITFSTNLVNKTGIGHLRPNSGLQEDIDGAASLFAPQDGRAAADRSLMRRLATLLLALLLSLAASAERADARILVGVGDQNISMFQDPRFERLHLDLTRLALPWDWYRDPSYVSFLDGWVAAAGDAHVRPLIAFNRNWRRNGDRYRVPRGLLRKSFRLFRARYPRITDFSAWNEANHTSQPTAKSPKLAARYYKTLRAACPHKCRIVAADVLDTNDLPAWIAKFRRYAPGARLWGLHSYKDPNNGTDWHIRDFLRQVKGEVWLTETGGIKRLKPAPGSRGHGRTNSLRGQAQAVKRVYALARSNKRIKRIYFYQWTQDRKQRWDSAFLDYKGRKRPALAALAAGLKRR